MLIPKQVGMDRYQYGIRESSSRVISVKVPHKDEMMLGSNRWVPDKKHFCRHGYRECVPIPA
jgi:hypothetical protein